MYQKITLASKRNKIERIFENGKSTICKTFTNLDDLKKEYETLCLLEQKGLNVPEIIDSFGSSLILQDLGDNTMLSWYHNEEKRNSDTYETVLFKLCDWLKNFYNIYLFSNQYILGDINFENFIIYNDDIYGIDFEHIRQGRIEEDAGRLVACALTYEPEDTDWKMDFNTKLIKILSSELNIDNKLINSELKKELISMKERRKQN